MLQGFAQHTPEAIRDTVASVFRSGIYNRSTQRTIGTVIGELIQRAFRAVFTTLRDSPPLRYGLLFAGFALILIIILRATYVAGQRARLAAERQHGGGAQRGTRDPLAAAQQAASDGRYADAAHHLYAALLDALARGERLRLHPSKTAGDYARELRARASPSATPFRSFVRAFEFVAYGHGNCDRDEYERLRALAAPLMERAA